MNKIYLCLQNGMIFEGESFGADVEATGEIVFDTSMVGYVETLTDKNYKNQIVVKTFPMIGNYGMVFEGESKTPSVTALVVREWCETPSNFRCEGTLSDYLKSNNIPAICGIDTRELTRIIRNEGTQNATICKTIPESLEWLKNFDCDTKVIPCEKEIKSVENKKCKVALINLGTVEASVNILIDKNVEVCVFPYNTTADEIAGYNPDGIFISDGPCNPRLYAETIEAVKKLLGKYSFFATGTGHLVLALANGFETQKHKYGHRGSNQPCVCTKSGKTYITTQNHGYIVDIDSISCIAEVSFTNANDKTCEGIEYKNGDFSVQFRPEGYEGVNNTLFLYDNFIKNMEK